MRHAQGPQEQDVTLQKAQRPNLLREGLQRLRGLFLPSTGGLHIGDNTLDAEADSGGNIDPFWKRADGTSSNLSTTEPTGTAGGELGGTYPNPTVDSTHSGTAHLSGATASGELGGTYPSPTVDSTHSGSAHHSRYTATEAITDVENAVTLNHQGDVTIAGNKTLKVDVIDEKDSAAGVTIDSVLLKDGVVTVGDVAFDDGTSDPLDVSNTDTAADGSENSVARKDHIHGFKPPSVRANSSASQTLTDATLTALDFPAESFDTDTMHDNVTNKTRLTFNTAGVYYVEGQAEFASNGTGDRFLRILLSNTTILGESRHRAAANDAHREQCGMLFNFSADDYVELIGFQDSGGDLVVNPARFYAFWVAPAP